MLYELRLISLDYRKFYEHVGTMNIMGSFEQVNNRQRPFALIDELILHLEFEIVFSHAGLGDVS